MGCAEELEELPSLWYLNLRQNKIDKMEDIVKFERFQKLKVLIVSGNPFLEKFSGDYFTHIVHTFKKLRRLNKGLILENERDKIKTYMRDKTLQALKEKQKTDNETEP